MSGDKTQYTLSKLPEIFGTGYAYAIEVSVVVTTLRENEVTSTPVSGIFVTRFIIHQIITPMAIILKS